MENNELLSQLEDFIEPLLTVMEVSFRLHISRCHTYFLDAARRYSICSCRNKKPEGSG